MIWYMVPYIVDILMSDPILMDVAAIWPDRWSVVEISRRFNVSRHLARAYIQPAASASDAADIIRAHRAIRWEIG